MTWHFLLPSLLCLFRWLGRTPPGADGAWLVGSQRLAVVGLSSFAWTPAWRRGARPTQSFCRSPVLSQPHRATPSLPTTLAGQVSQAECQPLGSTQPFPRWVGEAQVHDFFFFFLTKKHQRKLWKGTGCHPRKPKQSGAVPRGVNHHSLGAQTLVFQKPALRRGGTIGSSGFRGAGRLPVRVSRCRLSCGTHWRKEPVACTRASKEAQLCHLFLCPVVPPPPPPFRWRTSGSHKALSSPLSAPGAREAASPLVSLAFPESQGSRPPSLSGPRRLRPVRLAT